MTWDTSERAAQLPPNWPAIREAVKRRDGHRCTAFLANETRCPETTRLEVDHIDDPANHDMGNLRTLCHWHHAKRTSLQSAAARHPVRQSRPPETHPGLK